MLSNQKVYHGVLEEIRQFIQEKDLKPGDKLPSERDLSETLRAGRSSVREALRALELIGIIETRKGEGTYLSSYRPFQTVEILASFILTEKNTKESIISTRKILEKEVAKIAYETIRENDIHQLKKILIDEKSDIKQTHIDYFTLLFSKVENELLMKIWQLILEFSFTIDKELYDPVFYKELIKVYEEKQFSKLEMLFLP